MKPGHNEYIPLCSLAGGDLNSLKPDIVKFWRVYAVLFGKVVSCIKESSQPDCLVALMEGLEMDLEAETRESAAKVTSMTLQSFWKHHLLFDNDEKIEEFLAEQVRLSLQKFTEESVQSLMKKHIYFTERKKKGNRVTVVVCKCISV